MVGIEAGVCYSSAADVLAGPPPEHGTVALWWLGQAGFALRAGDTRVLIDPYLSDWLGHKYAGTPLPHDRLMPSPLAIEQASPVDVVLCSHAHGDHLDPWTLPAIAAGNPKCRFIVPRAVIDKALDLPLPPDRVVGLNDSQTLELPGCTVQAVAAAHEHLQTNEQGEHHYVGYILRLGGMVFYHSGDCVDYDGLADRLARERIDIALLPVNGRGKSAAGLTVQGNFTLHEAVRLCRQAGIGRMIAHHFGMFAFNTVEPRQLVRQIEQLGAGDLVTLPCPDRSYCIRAD